MDSQRERLKRLMQMYKNWISANPSRVDTIELTFSMLSYVLAGKFSKDILPSEVAVALRHLLTFLNDQILFSCEGSRTPSYKLRCWLTGLEYTQSVLELLAKYVGGERGKWTIAACLQTLKCIGRLFVIFHYKDRVITEPHVPRLRGIKSDVYDDPKDYHLLQNTGILIRKSSAVPSHQRRVFRIPVSNFPTDKIWNKHVLAEVLYIVKPLVELECIYVFGGEAWRSWVTSLLFDMTSLYLHSKRGIVGRRPYLTPYQHEIVKNRVSNVLSYAMRTPFYERHTKRRLYSMVDFIWRIMPLSPATVKTYLEQWRSIYFNVRPG